MKIKIRNPATGGEEMKILRLTIFIGFIFFYIFPAQAAPFQDRHLSIIVIEKGEKSKELTAEFVNEMFIAYFGVKLNLLLSGQEAFQGKFPIRRELKKCLEDQACVHRVASEFGYNRILYGFMTIYKRTVKRPVYRVLGGVKKKTRRTKKITIENFDLELTLYNPVEKKVEQVFTYKGCDLKSFSATLHRKIGEEIIASMIERPPGWKEDSKPSQVVHQEPSEVDIVTRAARPVISIPKLLSGVGTETRATSLEPIIKIPSKGSGGIPPKPINWWRIGGYGLVSAGVLVVGVGSAFGLASNDALNSYQGTDEQISALDHKERAEWHASGANVMFAVGAGIALSGGAVLLLDYVEYFHKPSSSRIFIDPTDKSIRFALSF